jgi:hypothetical protein
MKDIDDQLINEFGQEEEESSGIGDSRPTKRQRTNSPIVLMDLVVKIHMLSFYCKTRKTDHTKKIHKAGPIFLFVLSISFSSSLYTQYIHNIKKVYF